MTLGISPRNYGESYLHPLSEPGKSLYVENSSRDVPIAPLTRSSSAICNQLERENLAPAIEIFRQMNDTPPPQP